MTFVNWFKSKFYIDYQTSPINLGDLWNGFIDEVSQDNIDYVLGLVFRGSKVTITTIPNTQTHYIVTGVKLKFMTNYWDIWDALLTYWFYKKVPNVSVFGFTIPTGPIMYMATRSWEPAISTAVPQDTSVETTKFGNKVSGFIMKDLYFDLFCADTAVWISKKLGGYAWNYLTAFIGWIMAKRKTNINDAIMRIKDGTEAKKYHSSYADNTLYNKADVVFDDLDKWLPYLIDPYHVERPSS